MAGDWIKMRLSLQTHPKIVRILSATKSDKFRVVGGLHAVWSVFDTHSVDGRLDGYTTETLDHIIGWNGFSQAMVSVGWLVESGDDALALPDFDEHNGASGKRRAEDQKRKRDHRKSLQTVADNCGLFADKLRTREEKRREEESQTPMPTQSADPEDVRLCPVGSLVDLYHELMPENPRVKVLNDKRKAAIRARWKEAAKLDFSPFGYATRSEGLAKWRTFFDVCAESDFMTGKVQPAPGRKLFIADIDFIFSPDGFAKILENKYHQQVAK